MTTPSIMADSQMEQNGSQITKSIVQQPELFYPVKKSDMTFQQNLTKHTSTVNGVTFCGYNKTIFDITSLFLAENVLLGGLILKIKKSEEETRLNITFFPTERSRSSAAPSFVMAKVSDEGVNLADLICALCTGTARAVKA
ncbi:uncharacterized protein V6R79_010343 [Siganus canaliculatus]